jgi:hypothetical protein
MKALTIKQSWIHGRKQPSNRQQASAAALGQPRHALILECRARSGEKCKKHELKLSGIRQPKSRNKDLQN